MALIPKHFGLKSREESYLFKELDKIQQKTKKDFQVFKQRLLAKPALDEDASQVQRPRAARAQGKGRVCGRGAGPGKMSPPRKGLAGRLEASLALPCLLRPGLGPAAPSKKTQHFQPQSFYMRSSAFLRHRPQKRPPIIAPETGTAKPAVLLPPPVPRGKPRTLRAGPIPGPPRSRRLSSLVPEPEADHDAALPSEGRRSRDRKASAGSTGDEEDVLKQRRTVRIRTHFLRQRESGVSLDSLSSGAPGPGEAREALRASLRSSLRASPRPSVRASLRASLRASPRPSWQPHRVIPTSIDEIIASLQSETQLAFDQTIRELIQSVLGQNYDIKMDELSLMEQMGLSSSHKEVESLQKEAEQGSETSAEETEKPGVAEELTEAVSSVFQIEQEDAFEWTAMDRDSSELKLQAISEAHPEDESLRPLRERHAAADFKTSKKTSLKVDSAKFLQIKGKEIKRIQKTEFEMPALRPRKPLKSRWRHYRQTEKMTPAFIPPHIHDLCNNMPTQELPIELFLASRVLHTPDKMSHKNMLGKVGASFLSDRFTDEQRERMLYGIPVMEENKEDMDVSPTAPEESAEPEQRPSWHAQRSHLSLLGEEVSAYPGSMKSFWNPAAPKFGVPESVIRDVLYPKYESVRKSKLLTADLIFESQESITILDTSRKESIKSFILRKAASYENIKKPLSSKWIYWKRAKSSPDLRKEVTQLFHIKDDTRSNMKNLRFQQAKAHEARAFKEDTIDITVKESIQESLDEMEDKERVSFSLVEASRKAGISYIVYPKRKKLRWKKGLKSSKLTIVYEQLAKPPQKLERTMSLGILPGQKKFFLRVPVYELPIRSPSLPSCLDYAKHAETKGGLLKISNPPKWVADTLSKAQQQKARTSAVKADIQKDLPEKVAEPQKLELRDDLPCDLPPEVIKYYKSEVEALTEEINNNKTYLAFAYCRRGAIYRKLGKLQSAMSDLQQAIYLEPMFLNAYWHRHFLFLFQDKIADALDDLYYIHRYNKNNTEAYLSKAEIFKGKNDITLAILNYTQAIKCKPTDSDAYFRRGEVYEKTNRVLAVDDYSKCIAYDPKRPDALMKRGMFHFENENWNLAIQDFTSLLNIDHLNAQARTYRGRSYFKRQYYRLAAQDLSAAIHLDPNNWLAFYYRACLFRTTNVSRALQDYSISALLNDGYENLGCFLHRGILYTRLKLWNLAICDFESVISLERTVTLPYINIGLVQLLHLDNYTEAIWKFTEALKIDPLNIQSYICRAEAYHKLHNLHKAVRELSRAIHLQPDGIQLYIIRGQYLLSMKCFDLAKFTIYQVAEMNKGAIELSPVQQALIYSFCENHDKAIQVLDGVVWNKPEFTMYALLAKAQMKARKIKEAIKMFKKALEVYFLSDKDLSAVATSADCLYNLGVCYMEEGNYQMAFESFSKAVKANPDFSEAFYQRALCKVKLQKDNSIMDFNRAITLNPKHYQAYLSRVAFYGSQGRYSKAILNCNEAIKIYPQSVRAYLYRGVLKYYSKSYKLAITDLSTAVTMDKNNYVSFYNRALCYTKIGELQLALIDYGIVLLLEPGETLMLNTFINRGLIYTELEQYSFALEDFKQAAQIKQNNVSLCHAAAMCHHRIKEFEQAVYFFSWALKINSRFLDAYIGRGNSYMEYGFEEATKQAQKDFTTALHLNPAYTKARISLGYNLQAQGKFQKAWNHFTIAIEVDPRSYLAYEGRSVVCLQMGDNFAAMQDINAALKINTTAEFLTNRGVIHEFMGQKHNAMKDYQAAVSLDPTYSLAYYNAGNIYLHHRQFSQASDYFSKALKFDPENEYALMNRAVANTILEKYEEAQEDFSRLIKCCSSWAAVYFNRAHFYCCLKQYQLAEKDLSQALDLKPDDALAYRLRADVRGKIGLVEKAVTDYNQALDFERSSYGCP
ncbi:tetratricopeptide repeat protein 6 [Perognathus longimembris pacificus]|uniref:tetratricopeptide repeat protein 6 n=1 Tax=Perognathus longimembris pacificus TaxID=214514 RepID=UPI002019F15F|nr:tetratricopeptide repeat protein 6 [Perognathus longimembris pacificus]